MAEPKNIKALFRAMAEHGIDELELETADEKITIRRHPKEQETPAYPHE